MKREYKVFTSPTLQAVSRRTDLYKAAENIKTLLRPKNIHLHIDLIAGLPYETLETFKIGFNRAYELKAHHLQLGFLKLLHGSKLREQADLLGIRYNSEPPYEIIDNPWLNVDDMAIIKQTENALQHTHNKSRFLSTIEYVLSVSGLTPFELFYTIGKSAPHYKTHLDEYAEQIYNCLVLLSDVDKYKLQDCLIYDWMSITRNRKNLPAFLRARAGKNLVVDGENRDPVTGLYEVK